MHSGVKEKKLLRANYNNVNSLDKVIHCAMRLSTWLESTFDVKKIIDIAKRIETLLSSVILINFQGWSMPLEIANH